jgi:hypothetical protein
MTRTLHPGYGVGLLLLVTGCPVLDVAVEVKDVCLTYPGITIEGVPDTRSVNRSFVFDDLDGVRALVKEHADVQFVRAEVRARAGISDFAFVDTALVTMASGDPASKLPVLTVFGCDGDCLLDGNRLTLPASVEKSATEYLATDSILVEVVITGRLPNVTWTMDADICMNGQLDYQLEP